MKNQGKTGNYLTHFTKRAPIGEVEMAQRMLSRNTRVDVCGLQDVNFQIQMH